MIVNTVGLAYQGSDEATPVVSKMGKLTAKTFVMLEDKRQNYLNILE